MKPFFTNVREKLLSPWKQKKEVWDPDEFFSNQFGIHDEAFRAPVKENYMMLSSGINDHSAPEIWKESMKKEISEDFFYRWYTALDGFPTVNYAVKLYERFLFSRGNVSLKANLEVCMTVGASQAACLAVEYLRSIGKKKMLLVGMTYPLYVTMGNEYGYVMGESRSKLPNREMPTVDELKEDIERFKPDVLIFTYPSNPSGENYTDEELDQILQVLSAKGIYCVFDCVGNIIMSKQPVKVPEPLIRKNKMMKKSIIVNSFSKTESVPGFRIGYIAGDFDVVQFARKKQIRIMNPPNMCIVAVWCTMLFRCLYLSEQYGQEERARERIIVCFRRMFFATTVLCPQSMRDYVAELVEIRLLDEYEKYKKEMFVQEDVFHANKKYLAERLAPFLTASTQMDGGFNYLIKLRPCAEMGELEFCRDLLRKTGIAIFTESGFTLTKAKQDDYWVRISLGASKVLFRETIDRLYGYLSQLERGEEKTAG